MPLPIHTLVRADSDTGSNFQDQIRYALFTNIAFFASAASVTAMGSITAGTGFTSLPTLTPSGGTGSGLVVVATSLKVVSATVVAGGTGYVTNDTVTLANGVVLTVTASAGVATALAVATAGSATTAPLGAQSPISTSGVGTGLTATLVWGLSTIQIVNSGNYSVAPSLTVAGGSGSGASVAGGTLGGNGAAILVGLANVPDVMANNVTHAVPSIPAFVSQPVNVPAGVVMAALTPITTATTLTAGVIDFAVFC